MYTYIFVTKVIINIEHLHDFMLNLTNKRVTKKIIFDCESRYKCETDFIYEQKIQILSRIIMKTE